VAICSRDKTTVKIAAEEISAQAGNEVWGFDADKGGFEIGHGLMLL
jgi:hypothetical protein